MKNFLIVREKTLKELETKVNELIEQGYKPEGRLMDTFHLKKEQFWIIAMVKK